MKYCIPDELFNTIQYPIEGTGSVGIDAIVREIVYKMPKASDVVVRRETWHSVCDFCYRTGALLEKMTSSGSVVVISPTYGKFIRIVGAYAGGYPTTGFNIGTTLQDGHLKVEFPEASTNTSVIISVAPYFADQTTSQGGGGWTPRVPQYVIDRYGECIMHGSLMRLFAMGSQPWADINLARMHAVSYNNDLNRFSFGLITSGMRKHLLVDVEDFLIQANANGNG